jgi:hypothetical protein
LTPEVVAAQPQVLPPVGQALDEAATQSEDSLEMMAAHFCRARWAASGGRPACSSSPTAAPFRARARGMESTVRRRLPKAAALGRPRSRLWLMRYRPLTKAMTV